MKNLKDTRYIQLSGSPYQVGFAHGIRLKRTLASDIEHYLQNGPLKFGELTQSSIDSGAMTWFESLPERFRQEMHGMADGSGVSLGIIAAWGFADAGGRKACSSFFLQAEENLWIGRNNDLWVPDLWGYAIERQITGRLATLTFGMRGEIFAATGLNEAGLWLHYNWLPAFDKPLDQAWTPYVLLTEMLETCQSIDEVETFLKETRRSGGMLIFAAQHKQRGCCAALLECAPQTVFRKDLQKSYLAGTNHYQSLSTPQPPESYAPNSVKRLAAMRKRLTSVSNQPTSEDLLAILADPEVEQHQADYGTVYSNLVCLSTRELWFTFGGFPAASQGHWQKVPWPW